MEDREAAALHGALAEELRVAQDAAKLSAPRIEELTGIQRDTVRRILKGDRAVTAVEIVRLAEALQFDDVELVARAKARAARELDSPRRQSSARLREKLTLLSTASARTTDALYLEIAHHMSQRGFRFPRSAWNDLFDTGGSGSSAEMLFALADALHVDPRYLVTDDPLVDREVESHLRFHRAMIDLGVDEVAARTLQRVPPEEIDEMQKLIARVLKERQ